MTLADAIEVYKYLFIPKWKYLINPKTWFYALEQAFFSLSLAGSGAIVYGSYLKKSDDVIGYAKNVGIFASLTAMLASIVIIPSIFAVVFFVEVLFASITSFFIL